MHVWGVVLFALLDVMAVQDAYRVARGRLPSQTPPAVWFWSPREWRAFRRSAYVNVVLFTALLALCIVEPNAPLWALVGVGAMFLFGLALTVGVHVLNFPSWAIPAPLRGEPSWLSELLHGHGSVPSQGPPPDRSEPPGAPWVP